jgi:hypothetical protein
MPAALRSQLGLDAVATKDGPHPTVKLDPNGTTRAKVP